MLAEFTIQEFRNRFTSDAICMEYLVTQKWGEGYQCIKCGCIDWTKGRQWFYRRCKDCKYDESATCNTLFHGAKLSLLKVCRRVNYPKNLAVSKRLHGSGKLSFKKP